MNQGSAAAPSLTAPRGDLARNAPARRRSQRQAVRSQIWRRVWLGTLPWLVLTIVFVPGALIIDNNSPHPNGWHYVVLSYLACYMIWALYTPLIGLLLRRFPLSWPPKPGTTLTHLCCMLAMSFAHVVLMMRLDTVVRPAAGPIQYGQDLIDSLLTRSPFDVVLYAGTAACFVAWDALTRNHQRQLSLAQAQLDALKAQIEPHFLFNTLNAVSELVYRDPAIADRVVTQLAALLRNLVDQRGHEQSLREELRMLREYVSIQKTLLGERLKADWHVPDNLLDMHVPTLLLQPIYENAIRHGVGQLRHGGSVTLSVAAQAERLVITVRNDGPKLNCEALVDGLGLGNTRARLQTLYGYAHRLELTGPDAGGAHVTIELPLHRGRES